eukprot:262692_1
MNLNVRQFTNNRTLIVKNVPFSASAHSLKLHLNKLLQNYFEIEDSILRVQLLAYSSHKHKGTGKILTKSKNITNILLKAPIQFSERELEFSRLVRKQFGEETDAKFNQDDTYDDVFNCGPAKLYFLEKSYPYCFNKNHIQTIELLSFDFSNKHITARYYFQRPSILSSVLGATPKAIEFRIPFTNIINKIQFMNTNKHQPIMLITMYHPLRKYVVFPDIEFLEFDTEVGLCERFERSICKSNISQSMTILISLSRVNNECIQALKYYDLLQFRTTSIEILSIATYTISSPPDWIYKLPEDVRYLLSCLHSKHPSKLTFSSMTQDAKFVDLIIRSDLKNHKLLCLSLEYMFYCSGDYFEEPAAVLCDYIEQRFNTTNYDDVEIGFGYIRHAYVTLSGIQLFPSYLEMTNRMLRWYPNLTDHFMRVTFCEDNGFRLHHANSLTDETETYIKNVLKKGIIIGKRKYEFLAFGSSQLNEQSVWMYFDDKISNISADQIRRRMGDFSSIKSVAKYASRMGQCFSTTVDTIKTTNVRRIKDIKNVFPYDSMDELFTIIDIPSNLIVAKQETEICFSDGVGRISETFADKVARSMGLTYRPSAFQIRYAGCKGMVTVHGECKSDLELRDSMIKFRSNDKMFEVCRYSSFSPAFLNRQIIVLFETINNPLRSTTSKLVEIAEKCIEHLAQMMHDRQVALHQLNLRCVGAIQSPEFALIQLLNHNFPMYHPFIRQATEVFVKSELKSIQDRHRILIEQGASLLGVMDEYNILEPNEVFIQIQTPSIKSNKCIMVSGDVIITKCPTLAPGDLRKFEANCKIEVYEKLKHLKNVIVFSQKGILSPTMTMAGSDLDGDVYWITWDKQLLSCFGDAKNEKPLLFPAPKPKIVSNVTIDHLQDFFVDYIKMDCLGMLAHSHLAVAHQFKDKAKNIKCLILAVLNSYAVDYRKSGTPVDIKKIMNWYGSTYKESLLPKDFPYFMKKYNSCYHSRYALGKIYRRCGKHLIAFEQMLKKKSAANSSKFDDKFLDCLSEQYVYEAKKLFAQYRYEILTIQNRWGIKTEMELFMNRPLTYIKLPNLKEFDVKQKIRYQMNALKQKYRNIFFDEFKDTNDKKQTGVFIYPKTFTLQMKQKASSWYVITMRSVGKSKHSILSFPFVVFDVLCSILIENDT